MKALVDRIFSIQTEEEFNVCALEVFHFQKENTAVYGDYLRLLNRAEPQHYSEIPFLPIHFFKTHSILSSTQTAQLTFKSSGTTGTTRSIHFVAEPSIYERSFVPTFQRFVGDLSHSIIFALLPNYVDQGESSLVYMVDYLIRATNDSLSGFYLDDVEVLMRSIVSARKSGKQIILFGVSYALLDLAEFSPDLNDIIIIETGGMKGRRKEISKEELHSTLKKAFNCTTISSEYGMCELLSQAYSDANGLFEMPPWMRISFRDVNDPFSPVNNKTGGVNVIDLANIYSCSFIETQDLGKIENHKLRLMGRFDHSDIRGCNLLVE